MPQRNVAIELLQELLEQAVRKNVTIDWTVRENVRAQLRVLGQAHLAEVRVPSGPAGAGHAVRDRAG